MQSYNNYNYRQLIYYTLPYLLENFSLFIIDILLLIAQPITEQLLHLSLHIQFCHRDSKSDTTIMQKRFPARSSNNN